MRGFKFTFAPLLAGLSPLQTICSLKFAAQKPLGSSRCSPQRRPFAQV
jgi:hypothetical protein